MIKLIVLSVLLNAGEMHAVLPDDTKIERRRRGGKGDKKRKRGGSGLRQMTKKLRYSSWKKYWVFIREYRDMSDHRRQKKAALAASNNGKCWWVYEWMMAYPNVISKRAEKSYENS